MVNIHFNSISTAYTNIMPKVEEPKLKKIPEKKVMSRVSFIFQEKEKEPVKKEMNIVEAKKEKRLEKPTPKLFIRQGIISKLKDYGLTQEEFIKIDEYYSKNKRKLESSKDPKHISKDITGLPRSLVYVPSGRKKGLYILLKTHGGVDELGLGSYNRVTLCLHLESGKKKVFRTAKDENVHEEEIEANRMAMSHSDIFAVGIPITYQGSWTDRDRPLNMPKVERLKLDHEDLVEKVGFIMDLAEGGDLGAKLISGTVPSYKERVKIAYEYAESIAVLHELGLVQLDLKPENTFMTADGKPKISDFGFTRKVGENRQACGTPGYIAPEIAKCLLSNDDFITHPSEDIWSLGGVLADLMLNTTWYENNGQNTGDWNKILDLSVLEDVKELSFPKRRDKDSMDAIIDGCLKFKPDERPTAKEVAQSLRKIYATL